MTENLTEIMYAIIMKTRSRWEVIKSMRIFRIVTEETESVVTDNEFSQG